ncbi:MAG: hypothetical protein LBN30_08910 [Oscillospiraceae bacterium]|nr:hypothetical protein [Oscillospiraceae bacterium]
MYRKHIAKLHGTTRGTAFLLALLLLFGAVLNAPGAVASAAEVGDNAALNKKYWPLQGDYAEAVASGDSAAIAKTGTAIINLFLDGDTAANKAAQFVKNGDTAEISILWSTMDTVYKAYEKLGDIPNTVRVLKDMLVFAEPYKLVAEVPSDIEFSKTLIKNKIDSYDVEIAVYGEVAGQSGDLSYTGAKYEPKNGVYYGEPEDKAVDVAKKSSGTLVYVLFESENLKLRMQNAIESNKVLEKHSVIELAWNLYGEGTSLKSVLNERTKVTEAAKYLATLDTPIFLRFGAEMNVWQKPANPADFIAAFRFVADIMHNNAPNVAMVWSVNCISAEGLTFDMFYPGDSYVDWVGVSLYTSKYFAGNRNTSDAAAAIYGVGKFANPLRYLGELVNQYGAKKPIMIAEGGVENYSVPNSEDLTDWALPQLRKVYGYAPIIYPQLKALFYFNTFQSSSKSRFDLDKSPRLKSLYTEMTASSYFLGKGQTASDISYKKLGTATFDAKSTTLLTYAPYFTIDGVSVTYRLNGSTQTKKDIPYRATFDLSGSADGEYSLEVEVAANGSVLKKVTYNVRKTGASVTVSTGAIAAPTKVTLMALPTDATVIVDGKPVAFDAYSINDNNYFKLRDLAAALNGSAKQFEVSWDGAKNAISLTSSKAYTSVGGELAKGSGGNKTPVPTSSKIYKDGAEVSFVAYTINDNNYFKLRDIGAAFDFGIGWDGATNTITIDTSKGYTPA